jgi:hypothetical protein
MMDSLVAWFSPGTTPIIPSAKMKILIRKWQKEIS